MSDAQRTSKSNEWHTPKDLIELIRLFLGKIDLDPATSEYGNSVIRAKYHFTKETDGLHSDWPKVDTVFLNPPGNKVKNKSHAALFWDKLQKERTKGTFQEAIFLGFSLNIFQTSQDSKLSVLDFPFCVLRKRPEYYIPNETEDSQPTHPSVIIYIPGSIDRREEFNKFWSIYGKVKL